jgi:serine/threonine-protein kinase
MAEAEVLSPGQALGRYELLAQVARGGMGQVWVARLRGARGFHKLVAIKTLLPELRNDARIEQMLLEEARIASLIQHGNVVQTTELGEHRGYLYLVMEWIDGESLGFVLKRAEERGAVPLPVTVNLVAQACRGLHAAHELTNDLGAHLGVVHRDVSPHNILVTHGGVVKLVDFGIAKAMKEDTSFTENGEIKGKYSYMAPEQILGDEVDRRADVFSLAITLYLMTTGRHPFKAGEKTNLIRAVTSEEPPPLPSSYLPSYPRALEAVVMKALAKAPEQRYPSTEAMRVALEAALPEAFAPRFEAQVKDYLAKVMGDRAAARREALRRFQLAADERLVAEDPNALPQLASQSGGSLRAILIDNAPVEISHTAAGQTAPLVPRPSELPTELGRRRSRGPRVFGAVAAVALGALGFAGLRFLRPQADVATGAAPSFGVDTQLRSATPSPVVRAELLPAASPSGVPVASSTSGAPSTSPSGVPVASASGAPAQDPSALSKASKPSSALTASPSTSARAHAHDAVTPPHPAKKPHKGAESLDLLAPEYAK